MKKSVKIVAILTVLVMGVLTVLSACDGNKPKPEKKAIIMVTALMSGGLYDKATGENLWDPLPEEYEMISVLEDGIESFVLKLVAAKDENGFDYTVKCPDYLSLTGNLAVGFPGTDENPFTDGLIIWPKLRGGYECGVILNSKEDDDSGYMFYIDADGNAVDEAYQSIAEKYRDVIRELMERAETFWKTD